MFQLDDKFLQDVGLGDLPDDQKQAFLQHVYGELERRVGTQLTEGMSDDQLDEFEDIIDRKESAVQTWLQAHAPDYQQDATFQKLQQSTKLAADDARLLSEFAATKWLEVNRPDYRNIVASVLQELKAEIGNNRDSIIGDQA